jgi:hypothetical protein
MFVFGARLLARVSYQLAWIIQYPTLDLVRRHVRLERPMVDVLFPALSTPRLEGAYMIPVRDKVVGWWDWLHCSGA